MFGMSSKKEGEVALTFDDILLVPQYSEIIPSEVETRTQFTDKISFKIPIISSAMDTVTESKVAIVIAQEGGFGVIHKNLNIDSQVLEVEKVKKYESGMITDPITIGPDKPVSEALNVMKKYSISGIPITVDGVLVGILTNRDLRFETNTSQMISNIMTSENLITTKEGTTLEQAKLILQKHRIEKLPVVDSKNQLKGLITVKDIEKSQTFPLSSKDAKGRLLVGAAVGALANEERAEALIAVGVDIVVVDTAHGHSKKVLDMIRFLRSKSSDIVIVGGNVVTAEATEMLIKAGADVVKVGIGGGSICTTRMIAGVGVPQITAIKECAERAKALGKTVIADGGIKFSGDITKALALGANMVMIGGLLAGCDESPGETVLYQGRTCKVYRGMGSLGAMQKGSQDRYSQEGLSLDKLVPEGIEGTVSYKGSVSGVIYQLVGGLRSGMGYLGASHIAELQKKAHFIRISPQGLRESHVHDVNITKEAPNYRLK